VAEEILNPPGKYDHLYVAVRKGGFYDIDSFGLSVELSRRKAALVDEIKPEWAKEHPVLYIARGRFVEEPDPSLIRE
jgi:hypothetical protein